MALRAVIFDLGNVLVFHDNALLFQKLGERAGLSGDEVGRRLLAAPLWDASNRGRLDEAAIRHEVGRALGVDFGAQEFTALWSCHFTLNTPVFPVVEALSGKVKRLVLSNTNVAHRDWLLPRMPILGAFDHLVFSCDLGLIKPEPAIYLAALERAGVAPEEAAFFDDVAAYAEAATRVGIQGRVFRSAEDLPAQLQALGVRL